MRNLPIKKKYEIGYDDRGFYLGKKKFASLNKTHVYRKISSFFENLKRKKFKVYYSDNDMVAFLDGPSISIKFNTAFLEDLAQRCQSGKKLNNIEASAADLSEQLLNIIQRKDLINIDAVKSMDDAKTIRRVKRSNQYTAVKTVKVVAGIMLASALLAPLTNAISNEKIPSESFEEPISYESVMDDPQLILDESTIKDNSKTEIEQNYTNESFDTGEVEDVIQEEPNCFVCDIENLFYTDAVQEKYEKYYPFFVELSQKFGLDPDLIFALAMQESSCSHENHINDGRSACGMFQLEKAVWKGKSVSARVWNEETQSYEKVVYKNLLANPYDFERYCEEAFAIYQNNMINYTGYNIAYSCVCWNMGCGSFNKIMNDASVGLNRSIEDINSHPYNTDWLVYRAGKHGTYDHLERVVRYIEPGKTLHFTNVINGEDVYWNFECTSVKNDTNNYSR